MADSKTQEWATERGKTDAIKGQYNNVSNPSGFGILKSNDPILAEKYDQGYYGEKNSEE